MGWNLDHGSFPDNPITYPGFISQEAWTAVEVAVRLLNLVKVFDLLSFVKKNVFTYN